MNTLQDSINSLKAILCRNDLTDALATTFLQQSQTRIERTLRVPGQETIGTITGNSSAPTDQIIIPANFLSLKYLYTLGQHGSMELLSHQDIKHFFASTANQTGITPKYYSRVGGSFLITPVLAPLANIWMVYYASQPQLIVPTDQNFFTISCADLLTYGALSYAADFFVDDRVQAFEGRFGSLMEDITAQGIETDMAQSDMAIAPAYNTEY